MSSHHASLKNNIHYPLSSNNNIHIPTATEGPEIYNDFTHPTHTKTDMPQNSDALNSQLTDSITSFMIMTRKTLNKLQSQQKQLYKMFTATDTSPVRSKNKNPVVKWSDSSERHYSTFTHCHPQRSIQNKYVSTSTSTPTLTRCYNIANIRYEPLRLPIDLFYSYNDIYPMTMNDMYSLNLAIDLIAFDNHKLDTKSEFLDYNLHKFTKTVRETVNVDPKLSKAFRTEIYRRSIKFRSSFALSRFDCSNSECQKNMIIVNLTQSAYPFMFYYLTRNTKVLTETFWNPCQYDYHTVLLRYQKDLLPEVQDKVQVQKSVSVNTDTKKETARELLPKDQVSEADFTESTFIQKSKEKKKNTPMKKGFFNK